MWFPDAPGDYALNKSIRGKISRATEQAEEEEMARQGRR